MSSRFSKPLFWFILAVGIVLRFHALDRQSLWDDEMSTIHSLSTPVHGLLQRFATYETHPPLYFLQLRLWATLHFRSLVKLRANSALWGSLSLFLAYLIGCRYGGEELGLLTIAFLALSPFHLAYSQEMRPYTMAMALGLASLLVLEEWLAVMPAKAGIQSMLWTPASAGVTTATLWTALLYTHYWGAFIVAAQTLYGYLSISKGHRKPVLVAFGAASGLFALWLPILTLQLGVIDRLVFWASAFSITNLAKVFLAYSGILFNMASGVFFLPTRVWVLAMIGLLFAAALIRGILAGPRAAVLWLSVGLGVPWLLSLWKASIFVWYRYPVLMLPAFALLVASGLLALTKGPSDQETERKIIPYHSLGHFVSSSLLRSILVIVLLGSQVWGCWVYFHEWQKANSKAVVQYVHWLRKPDTVVVRPAYFSDLFNFYDQGLTTTLDEHVLDSPEKRAALRRRNVVFLAFDVPSDAIGDALLNEFKPVTARYFPGTAHLGITVYELR